MTTPPIPLNLSATIAELLSNGWSLSVEQAEDTGRNPFIRVQAFHSRHPERIVTTWHTRETGGQRYRWRSAHHGDATVPTLAKLRDIITKDTTHAP